MKVKYLIGAMSLVLLVAGCKPENKPTPPSPQPINPPTVQSQGEAGSTATGEQVKAQVEKAATLTRGDVLESKDEAVAGVQKELEEMDGKLAQLSDKCKGYRDTAKVNADALLGTLQEHRQIAGQKLDALKSAGTDAWKESKAALDSSVDALRKKFEDLKGKI